MRIKLCLFFVSVYHGEISKQIATLEARYENIIHNVKIPRDISDGGDGSLGAAENVKTPRRCAPCTRKILY